MHDLLLVLGSLIVGGGLAAFGIILAIATRGM